MAPCREEAIGRLVGGALEGVEFLREIPSPRPSPRSFVTGRGRQVKGGAERLCRAQLALLSTFLLSLPEYSLRIHERY